MYCAFIICKLDNIIYFIFILGLVLPSYLAFLVYLQLELEYLTQHNYLFYLELVLSPYLVYFVDCALKLLNLILLFIILELVSPHIQYNCVFAIRIRMLNLI